MTKEYIIIRQQQIDKLKQNSQENTVSTTEIKYKPGLIAEFRGVHPDTNRHVLKVIFIVLFQTKLIINMYIKPFYNFFFFLFYFNFFNTIIETI